jgi:hypothetical protein
VGRGELAQELLAWVGYGLQADLWANNKHLPELLARGGCRLHIHLWAKRTHLPELAKGGHRLHTYICGQTVYYSQLPV